LDFDPFDDPGQPKSADRSSEEMRIVTCGHRPTETIAPEESEGPDMTTEGPGGMMVLAVNVIGDRAAERDEPCTWRRRQKPAARKGEGEQRRERKARLRAQDPGRLVEGHETVEAPHVDRSAFAVEAGVAIRPAQATGKNARCVRAGHQAPQLRAKARSRHPLRPSADTPPRQELVA
jgi:hypothetical protein